MWKSRSSLTAKSAQRLLWSEGDQRRREVMNNHGFIIKQYLGPGAHPHPLAAASRSNSGRTPAGLGLPAAAPQTDDDAVPVPASGPGRRIMCWKSDLEAARVRRAVASSSRTFFDAADFDADGEADQGGVRPAYFDTPSRTPSAMIALADHANAGADAEHCSNCSMRTEMAG